MRVGSEKHPSEAQEALPLFETMKLVSFHKIRRKGGDAYGRKIEQREPAWRSYSEDE
jgi:hypothetical protein